MKQKLLVVMLTAIVAFSATGCGVDTLKAFKSGFDAAKASTETEEATEDVSKENTEEATKAAASDTPVFGDNISDYDGFEYLYCETLTTQSEKDEDTEKMANKSIAAYIPEDEYAYVDRDRASVDDKMGVDFDVQLSPYLQYDSQDYTDAENLQAYVDENYDEFYYPDYKNVEMSEPEELANGGVAITVTFVNYDSYDDAYSAQDDVYELIELEDGLTAMIEIQINGIDATGKTNDLLAELGSYYQLDLSWDADAGTKRVDDYMNSDAATTNMVSTGSVMFELPENWSQDSDAGDYSSYIYAPDGDVYFADGYVQIGQEYAGIDVSDMKKMAESDLEGTIESILGEDLGDVSVSEVGDTNLGYTVKIDMTIDFDDTSADATEYLCFNDNGYVYIVAAVEAGDSGAALVAQNILDTASLKD